MAKYSCKASHEQITSRDTDPDRWRDRGVPEHLIEMAVVVLAELAVGLDVVALQLPAPGQAECGVGEYELVDAFAVVVFACDRLGVGRGLRSTAR